MSDLIRLKRSSVVGSVPASLEFGEIALNYADGIVYYKNSLGVIVALTTGTPAVVVPTDADFASVSLLLHGDGNLTDSSSLARTVTAVGTVTSNGAAKFGTNSLAFVGSGKLTIPTDASLTFAGDFTVEFWCKFSALSYTYGAFFAGDSGATQMFLTTKSDGQGIRWGLSATAEYANGNCTWAIGQWYHVAVKRASGAVTFWVDGINVTNGSPSNATTYSGGLALMGGIASVQDFNGLVDDFRVTKGVARAITVPTAAYPNAGPAVTTPTDADFASVSLLLHMDGTGASFVDSSGTPKTVTAVAAATQSATQSKWGGKSAYFGGAGDYLSVTGDATAFGTADFAVEFWLYYTGTGSQYSILDTRSSSSGFAIYKATDDTLRVYSSGSDIISGGAITANAWIHVAMSRSSSGTRLYVNGAQAGATFTTPLNCSDQLLTVGADFPRNGRWTQGYVDDLRITKGTARGYTGATITVPTAAYPNS